jgi:hypothetical protein
MSFESEKIMFEIYKDPHYSNKYHVVYYSELNEHNKNAEISRAMAGTSYYDGFIKEFRKEEAKIIISGILDKLNSGFVFSREEISNKLKDYLAPS